MRIHPVPRPAAAPLHPFVSSEGGFHLPVVARIHLRIASDNLALLKRRITFLHLFSLCLPSDTKSFRDMPATSILQGWGPQALCQIPDQGARPAPPHLLASSPLWREYHDPARHAHFPTRLRLHVGIGFSSRAIAHDRRLARPLGLEGEMANVWLCSCRTYRPERLTAITVRTSGFGTHLCLIPTVASHRIQGTKGLACAFSCTILALMSSQRLDGLRLFIFRRFISDGFGSMELITERPICSPRL